MILRLSQKLCTKIKTGTLNTLPLEENPLADWSAHLFVADRKQYIILSNTKSLYSVVMPGRGITNDRQFIERALSSIREFMKADSQESVYDRFIATSSGTVSFATALDRSVTGSMNDLVFHAKTWLIEREHSPYDAGFRLNEIPFSSLSYSAPNESFKAMHIISPDK